MIKKAHFLIGSLFLFVTSTIHASQGVLILRRASHTCPGLYAPFSQIKIDQSENGIPTRVSFRLDFSSSMVFKQSSVFSVTQDNFSSDSHPQSQKFGVFADLMENVKKGQSLDLEYLEKPSPELNNSYELGPYDPSLHGQNLGCERRNWGVSNVLSRFEVLLKMLDVNVIFFENVPTPDLSSQNAIWKTIPEYALSVLPAKKSLDVYAQEMGVGFGSDPIGCSESLLKKFIKSSKNKYAYFLSLNRIFVESGISIVSNFFEILDIRFQHGGRVVSIAREDLNATYLKRNAFLGAMRVVLYGDRQSPERTKVGATFVYAADPKVTHEDSQERSNYGPYMCKLQKTEDAQDKVLKEDRIWPRFLMVKDFGVVEGALDDEE